MKITRKSITKGIIIRLCSNKTVKVKVLKTEKDPKYGKVKRKFLYYSVHDENNICTLGDEVLIKKTRPLSKTKRWIIEEILSSIQNKIKVRFYDTGSVSA